jgi:hypothetical protein
VERTYASTGSNTFTGLQNFSNICNPNGFNSAASISTAGGLQVTYDSYFSSSVFVNGNLTVFGTQSVVHVSSSQFNIGTNIITVNTSTPSIRYGGLSVYDSGSTGLSGSIFWDSEANHWIYANASGSGGGSTYAGGMFISGPRSSGLGCEQGTTSCMLLVGQGGDHLTSSLVYHDSTKTCIPNCLIVGGALSGTSGTFTRMVVGGSATSRILQVNTSGNDGVRILTSGDNPTIDLFQTAAANAGARNWRIVTNWEGWGTMDFQSGTNNTNDPSTTRLSLSGTTGAATFSNTLQSRGLVVVGASGGYTTGDNTYINLGGSASPDTFGAINAPFGDVMKFNSYHGYQFKTSNSTSSPITMFSIGIGGAATFASSVAIGGTDAGEKLNIVQGNIKLYSYQNSAEQYRYIGSEYAQGNGNNRAEVRFGIDGSDTRTFISFATAASGGTITERMRITAAGASQFDGPALSIGSQGTYAIQVGESGQKHLTLSYKQSCGGYIQTWQSTPLYFNSQGNAVFAGSVRLDTLSDERVKDNIQPITNSLNKVLSITGKKFHLKDEPEDKLRYGFIAQELDGILDEFIINTNTTFKKDDLVVENVKSIENWASSWSALLVEAIKEQQCTINTLKSCIGIS